MRLICGAGLNNRTYPSKVNSKITKEYRLWTNMLERCTQKFWSKSPTYTGVACSDNFKSYTFFYEWCHKQFGFGNKDDKGRLWQLDKDLLIRGNKVYSETTCVFVPQNINSLLTRSEAKRGKYLIGVCWDKQQSRFGAYCKDGKGKKINLGKHSTEKEAFLAYKTFKEALIKEFANDYRTQLDPRAYQALMNYQVEVTD